MGIGILDLDPTQTIIGILLKAPTIVGIWIQAPTTKGIRIRNWDRSHKQSSLGYVNFVLQPDFQNGCEYNSFEMYT